MLSGGASAELSVISSYDSAEVTVSGETEFPGDSISLKIWQTGKEPLILMRSGSDEKGGYKEVLSFSDYETGKYNIKAATYYGSSEKSFSFVKTEDAAAAANALNSANTAADIKALFDNETYKVVLDADAYGYDRTGDKERLYNLILKGKPYSVQSADKLSEKLSAIGFMWAFNSLTSAEEAEGFMKQNADIIGVSALKSYETESLGYLREDFSKSWYDEARKIKRDTLEEFIVEYNEKYIIKAVKYLKNSNMTGDFLNDCGAKINYNGFKSLSTAKQASVGADIIIAGSYASLEELCSAFDRKVDEAMKNDTSSDGGKGNPGGSGGGGGGGGSAGGKTVNVASVEEPSKEEKAEFSDMQGFEWAKEAVESLKKQGVISGISETLFCPERNVTREEFSKLITSVFGFSSGSVNIDFEDVSENEWFFEYVSAAYSNGIVNGISKTHFGTGESITREDAACMIFRALNKKGINLSVGESGFYDKDDFADYAEDAISALEIKGLISGKGNGCFSPKDYLTRAEAAQLIYNVRENAGNN